MLRGFCVGGAAFSPGSYLALDVARRGHDRRTALELASRIDHAAIEVVKDLADPRFIRLEIELSVEFEVLHPQAERGRAEPAEVLGLDLPSDPPSGS